MESFNRTAVRAIVSLTISQTSASAGDSTAVFLRNTSFLPTLARLLPGIPSFFVTPLARTQKVAQSNLVAKLSNLLVVAQCRHSHISEAVFCLKKNNIRLHPCTVHLRVCREW